MPSDERWFSAPGRVNLIGDHTDYNEGFVLPVAIDLYCTVRTTPRSDGLVRLRSLDVDGEVELAADGSTAPEELDEVWGRYAAGVVSALAQRGRPAGGIDAVISSTVPLGAGLSSSAALEVGSRWRSATPPTSSSRSSSSHSPAGRPSRTRLECRAGSWIS